jgi:hypothetical protein
MVDQPRVVRTAPGSQTLSAGPTLLGMRRDHSALDRSSTACSDRSRTRPRGPCEPIGAPLYSAAEAPRRSRRSTRAVALSDPNAARRARRVAEHVHDDDAARPLGDRRLDRGRDEVSASPGRRPRTRARRPSMMKQFARSPTNENRRCDHLVARADARDAAEQVQARGAARDRGRVRRADALGDSSSKRSIAARARAARSAAPRARAPPRARRVTARESGSAVAVLTPRGARGRLAYSSHCAQRSLCRGTVSRYASGARA